MGRFTPKDRGKTDLISSGTIEGANPTARLLTCCAHAAAIRAAILTVMLVTAHGAFAVEKVDGPIGHWVFSPETVQEKTVKDHTGRLDAKVVGPVAFRPFGKLQAQALAGGTITSPPKPATAAPPPRMRCAECGGPLIVHAYVPPARGPPGAVGGHAA